MVNNSVVSSVDDDSTMTAQQKQQIGSAFKYGDRYSIIQQPDCSHTKGESAVGGLGTDVKAN